MLDFSVPDIDPAMQHTVAAWLDRLPYASPANTAQQLVAALHALNGHPLGADDRNALRQNTLTFGQSLYHTQGFSPTDFTLVADEQP